MARTIIKTGFGTEARTTGGYDLMDIKGIGDSISLIKQSFNLRELYKMVSPIILDSIKQRFEDGNASDPSNQWDKLHSETIRKKRDSGYSNPEQILVMSGDMMNSIRVGRLTSYDLKIVCYDRKGPTHEYGGIGTDEDGESFDIPARPFMYLEPNIVAEVWSVLNDFVNAGMSGISKKALSNYKTVQAGLPEKLTMNKQTKFDLEVRINKKPVDDSIYDPEGMTEGW